MGLNTDIWKLFPEIQNTLGKEAGKSYRAAKRESAYPASFRPHPSHHFQTEVGKKRSGEGGREKTEG